MIIVGAGGHAKVILDILHLLDPSIRRKIIGFLDSTKERGSEVFGSKILGWIEDLPSICRENDILTLELILAIGDNYTRWSIYNTIQQVMREESIRVTFPHLIHPSAIIGDDCKIGEGTIICACAIVGPSSVIGNHCILNTFSSIDHDGKMNDFSSLGPRSTLGGGVKIGRCSHIGMCTCILEKVIIGDDVVVGACSMVNRHVESNTLNYGIPNRMIKKREAGEKYLH